MADAPGVAQTVQRYLAVLRRQWWIIVLVVLAAVATAVYAVQRADPVYQAQMKIVVGQGRALFGPDVSGAVAPFTQTMSELLRSEVVARRVVQRTGLDRTPRELLERLDVTSAPDTSVLVLKYAESSRANAVTVLDEIGRTFSQLVDEEFAGRPPRTQAEDAPEPVSAVVFDPAHVTGQVSPKPTLTIALAALLSLVVGVLLAVLRDVLASRIRTPQEAESAYGAQVVGILPRGGLGQEPTRAELSPSRASTRLREAVQLLGAVVSSASANGSPAVLIASAMPEEGKSTVAANLAHSLAVGGRQVLVVEADTRRPALHRYLGEPAGRPGMLNVIRGEHTLAEALIPVRMHAHDAAPVTERQPALLPAAGRGGAESRRGGAAKGQLDLLPAGTAPAGAMTIPSVSQLAGILADLRGRYDFVFFDSSPLLLTPEAYPIAQLADLVLVVAREGGTRRRDAEQARAQLRSIGVDRYSVVVTESSEGLQRRYGYGYGHAYDDD